LEPSATQSAPDARQARTGTRHLVEEMLTQRNRMLKLLWQLSGQDLASDDETVHEMLDDFLSVLVDYIAAGHFGLYDRIARGDERRTAVVDTARDIYPTIADTTRAAVDFNEHYGAAPQRTARAGLAAELSRLGEVLTNRIELEDRLIRAMLGTDWESVASA
jgi:regulator of sigma D